VADKTILYTVLFKNSSIKITQKSSMAMMQLVLKDVSGYTPSDDSQQEAPITVIIIAVAVGGLISSFCIGVLVYMILKAVRNRRKNQNQTEPHPDEIE
jgi:flagellar biosynthesis protein FliP